MSIFHQWHMLWLVSLTNQNLNDMRQQAAYYLNDGLEGMLMLSNIMQKQSSGHTDASLCISATATSTPTCLKGVIPLSSAFECCFFKHRGMTVQGMAHVARKQTACCQDTDRFKCKHPYLAEEPWVPQRRLTACVESISLML